MSTLYLTFRRLNFSLFHPWCATQSFSVGELCVKHFICHHVGRHLGPTLTVPSDKMCGKVLCGMGWRWASNYFHNNDKVLKQLTKASSIDSVLELASSVDTLTPPQVSAATVLLDRLAYDHLSTYPWAVYDNRTLLSVQSFINCESKEYFQLIVKCPEFKMLLNEAYKCCTSFSNLDLASTLVSLLRLHVDPSCPAVVALLQECQARMDSFDLESLAVFSDCSHYLKRSGFYLMSNIARILQDQWQQIDVTSQSFESVARLLPNVCYFVTKDTMWCFQSKLGIMVSQLQDEIQARNVIKVMQPVSRFSPRVKTDFIKACFGLLNTQLDTLSLWDLGRAMMFFQEVDKPAHNFICQKISDRVLRCLHSDSLRAADVTYLLQIFDQLKYPGNSCKLLENLLEDSMNDMDALLLKNVSVSHILLMCQKQRLLWKFCHRVQDKIHDICESFACMLSIVDGLAKMKNRPSDIDASIADYVFRFVNSQNGFLQPGHLSTFGRYLVQRFGERNEQAASVFSHTLIAALPNMSISNMLNVALGFSAIAGRQPRLYTDYILSKLASEVLQKRDEINSLKILSLFSKIIFLKISYTLRVGLTQDLVELYVKHTLGGVGANDIKNTIQMLTKLGLRITDVLERLTCALLSLSNPSLSEVSHLLLGLAALNYRPSKLEELRDVAVEVALMEMERATVDVVNILRVTNSLLMLDLFPANLLSRVLSLNFLEKLEDILAVENSMSGRKYLQNLLLQVNRSVVLQCPHLSVPWFCEVYCENPISLLETSFTSKWRNFMYDGLVHACGGVEFVKMGPLYAPYGLAYDFECALDKDDKPMPTKDGNDSHLRQSNLMLGLHRYFFRQSSLFKKNGIFNVSVVAKCLERRKVAILLLMPANFSVNSKYRTASVDMKAVQLEILGFRVVQFPLYELESMQLSDSRFRKQYFREKILKIDG